MKTRRIIILGIVAFIAVIAWTLLAFTKIQSIPSEHFSDTLLKQPEITMSFQMTGAPQSLPLALRIRFPKQTSPGSIGFPDKSDVYVLNTGSGDIECIAHVRKDDVCHVTLNGHAGVEAMRDKIQDLFPGLSVD